MHPADRKATLLQWIMFSFSCIRICVPFQFHSTTYLQIVCIFLPRLLALLEWLHTIPNMQCNAQQCNSQHADGLIRNSLSYAGCFRACCLLHCRAFAYSCHLCLAAPAHHHLHPDLNCYYSRALSSLQNFKINKQRAVFPPTSMYFSTRNCPPMK